MNIKILNPEIKLSKLLSQEQLRILKKYRKYRNANLLIEDIVMILNNITINNEIILLLANYALPNTTESKIKDILVGTYNRLKRNGKFKLKKKEDGK